MSNVILLLYYVVLTLGFYLSAYGSSKRKPLLDLIGTILVVFSMAFLVLNDAALLGYDKFLASVLGATSLILVFPIRFMLKKKWVKEYQQEKFTSDYATLVSTFFA